MHALHTLSPAIDKAEILGDAPRSIDPFGPRTVARSASLLYSLQHRTPEQRREALGESPDDKFSLAEISRAKTLSERPPIAIIARAAEQCGLPVVLVWRRGRPLLGIDFRRRESF